MSLFEVRGWKLFFDVEMLYCGLKGCLFDLEESYKNLGEKS